MENGFGLLLAEKAYRFGVVRVNRDGGMDWGRFINYIFKSWMSVDIVWIPTHLGYSWVSSAGR
jgi:hypothetical protein